MTTLRLSRKAVNKHQYNCSELDLHAYVDGELDNIEQARVLGCAQKSPEIRTQLFELAQLKELVRLSY